MKIAIVTMHCLRDRATRYVNEIAPHFIEAGHEVHVFANKWDSLDQRIRVHRIPTLSSIFYVRELIFTVLATILMKFYRFDVTIAQPTRYFSPSVCYVQFVYESWVEKRSLKKFTAKLAHMMAKHNINKAKNIISVSDFTKDEIKRFYGAHDDKIRVIHSGVDTKKFSPENRNLYREEIRKELKVGKTDILLIFVGNPYKRKGLEYLIRALPSIERDDVRLLILGKDIGKDKLDYYISIAKELGIENKVIYGGFRPDVNKCFSASDVFIFPTIYEPLGLVVLEALASGLPIIISRSAGSAELLKEGEDGLFLNDPTDPAEMASKINFILRDDRFIRFGENAYENSKAYTWGHTAKKMLDFFGGL